MPAVLLTLGALPASLVIANASASAAGPDSTPTTTLPGPTTTQPGPPTTQPPEPTTTTIVAPPTTQPPDFTITTLNPEDPSAGPYTPAVPIHRDPTYNG